VNKLRYRVIFNVARGQRIVVQENARSGGKQSGHSQGEGSAPRVSLSARLRPLARSIAAIGLSAWVGGSAVAQVVADRLAPGNQQPTVLNSANGVLQVNIQSPSAAGVSRNTYTQFDVPGSGVVLNNSRTQVQTQLGGWVRGNPWLAKGEARVILNEVVRATGPSQLRGFIEVGGGKADVIIANPAGIDIAGGGFINVGRATLTTGVPIMPSGNLDAYAVTRGNISITGAGLDASQTDYTDLIARSVEINAGVWAKQLSVTVGANQIGADIGAVPMPINADPGSRPAYAIDVGQLGGMYANKIFLVGTEAGVGVRNAGNIGAAAGEVVLSANGNVSSSGSISATTGVALRAWGNLDQNGVLRSDATITVDANGTLTNRGEIQAERSIALASQADVDNEGKVFTPAQLALSAQGTLSNSGTFSGQSGVQASAARIANRAVISSTAEVALTASGALDNGTGTIQAGRLAIDAQGGIKNRQGKVIQDGPMALAISAATLMNTEAGAIGAPVAADTSTNIGGPISGDVPAQPDVPTATTPVAGDTPASSSANAQSSGPGIAAQAPAGFIRSAGIIANQTGEISANGPIDLSLQQLDNSAGKASVRSLSVSGKELVNRQGRLSVAEKATVRVADMDNSRGEVLVGGVFDGQIGNVDNRGGRLQAGRLQVEVADKLDNGKGVLRQTGVQETQVSVGGVLVHDSGLLESPGDVVLSAGSIAGEKGVITVLGDLTLKSGATSARQGVWTVAGVADISTAALDNTGGAISAGIDAQVRSASLDNVSGNIGAVRDVSIDANGYLDNRDGHVQAGRDLSVAASGELRNTGGTMEALSAASRLTVSAGDIDNRQGRIVNVGAADTKVTAQAGIVNSGTIAGNGAVMLGGQTLQNLAAGDIASGQDMVLAFKQSVDNSGWVRAGGTLDALEPGANFTNKGVVFSAEKMRISASKLDNSGGQMATATAGGGDIVVEAAELANRGGSIVADGDAVMSVTGAADNSGGVIQARRNLSVSVGGALNNQRGAIEALSSDSTFNVSARDIDNTDGRLVNAGVGNTFIASQTGILNSGTIAGQGHVALRAETIGNLSAGVIVAGNDLELGARASLANAGNIHSKGDLNIDQAGANIVNQGKMFFAGDASVRAARFDNDGGQFASADGTTGKIAIAAQSLSNRAGTISSAGKADFDIGAVDPATGVASGPGTFDNMGGVVQAAGPLTIQATGALNNDQGLIESNGTAGASPTTLSIQAASVSNLAGAIGNVGKGNTDIRADGAIVSSGTIAANGELAISGNTIDNRVGGRIVTAANLVLDAREQLSNAGEVHSAGKLDFNQYDAGFANQGKIFFGGDASVRAARFNNDGGQFASASGTTGNIAIAAQDLSNRGGAFAAGGDASFDIDNSFGTAAGAAGAFDNTDGIAQAAGVLRVTANGALSNDRGLIESAGTFGAVPSTLTLQAASISNMAGRISNVATGASVLQASQSITSSGVIAGNGALDLIAQTLRNESAGVIASAGAMRFDLAQQAYNAGQVSSAGTFDFQQTGAALVNRGNIVAGSAVRIAVATADNAGGRIATATGSGADLSMSAGSFDNQAGKLLSDRDLGLTVSGPVDNRGGAIQAARDLTASAGGAWNNDSGVVEATGPASVLQLQAQSVSNLTGRIVNAGAGSTAVNGGSGIVNSGVIAGNGGLGLSAQQLDNRGGGSVVAVGALDLGISQRLENQGTMESGGALTFNQSGAQLVNTARIASAGALDMRLAGFQNSGNISTLKQSGSGINIDSQVIDNRGGTVASDGKATMTSGSTLDNAGGTMQAGSDMSVSAVADLSNQVGVIEAVGTAATLTLKAGTLTNGTGRIVNLGAGLADVQSQGTLTNAGIIAGNGDLELVATTLDNQAAGTVSAKAALVLGVTQQVDNAGLIQSGGTLTFDQSAAGLKNNGRIEAAGNAVIVTNNVVNDGGKIGTSRDSGADLTLTTGAFSSTGGQIATDRDLKIDVKDLQAAGELAAGRDLSLKLVGNYTHTADVKIKSGRDIALDVSGDLTNTATLEAVRDLAVSASRIDNQAGSTIRAQGVTLMADTDLINAGDINANNKLSIEAKRVDNTSAIVGDTLTMKASILDNTGSAALVAGVTDASLWIGGDLNNIDGATIYSGGKLSIAASQALDRTGRISNRFSTIEATGDLAMAANIVENVRDEVQVTKATVIDQDYTLQLPGWHQTGPNENKYDPASANYRPQEIYYVNPADIIESVPMYTPYGEQIWKVTYQAHSNDTAFFRATSGAYGAQGRLERIPTSAGTRTVYAYARNEGSPNPDQVSVGGDIWGSMAADRPIVWSTGTPALSSAYGNCASDCIRLVTEPGYTDPGSTTLMIHAQYLGTAEEDKEATRTAHHKAEEDQIVSGGGAPSQILAGGNMHINVGQTLSNEYATIAAAGQLTIDGSGDVVNKGVTLYRTHTFDGTWTTGGGTETPLATSTVSEEIGSGGGVISGGKGVSITGRSFTNIDVSAGTAANIRSQVLVAGSGAAGAGSLGGAASANGLAAGSVAGAASGSGTSVNAALEGGAQSSGVGINASLRSVSGGSARNTSLGNLNARGGAGIVGEANLGAGQSLDAQGKAGAVLNIVLGGLFRQNTGEGGKYLLETRSEFASRDTWLGSDYMLAALNTDPASMQKRLGDGFHEQRLVREQLLALTGKVIGTAGDDSAYQAMLNSGVSYAQQWDLRPGVALTPEQMAQLTSDIVWLENQTVRLPDGSTHTVLVPKVYVAQVGGNAVTPTGALVTGGSVSISADQITNQGGVIDGGNGRTVLVASNDINNLGGAIRGGVVDMYADGDIRNESLVVSDRLPAGQTRVMASNQASITASGNLTISAVRDVINVAGLLSAGRGATGGDAIVYAGRDILLDSQALVDNRSMSGGNGQLDSESLTHRQSQLDTGGDLALVAGRDLTLNAAQIAIGTNPAGAGYKGAGVLQAGRDLSLNAVVDSYASRNANGTEPKNSNYLGWSAESVLGTQIVAGGDLSLRAGALQTGNLGIAGSAVASGGALALEASGDILLTTVEQTKDYAHKAQSSSSGFLSSRSSTSIANNSETLAIGSSLSGQTVTLKADRDISIEGARVIAQDDLAMKAGRDLTITSAEERSSADSFEESRRSGFFVGSFGVGYAATKASDAGDGTSVTQRGSLLSGDNVQLTAGRDLGILGSTVVAEGDLKLKAARDIDIVSTQNRSEQSSESHRSESGVLGKFGRPSVGTISVNQDGQGKYVEQVGSMVGSLGGNVDIEAGGTYTQTASEVNAAAGFVSGANSPTAGNITIRAGEVLINEAMNTTSSQQHTSQRKTAIGPQLDMPLLNAAKSLRDVAQAAGETSDTRSQAMAAATMAMQANDIASGVQGAAADPGSLKNGLKLTFALGSSRSESSMSQQSETSVGSTVRGSGNVSMTATGIPGDTADGGTTGNITVVGSQVQAGGTVALKASDRIDLLASKDSFTQTSNSRSSGASVGIGIAFGGDQKGFTLELAANRARANADGTDTIYQNTHIQGGSGVTLTSGGDTTLRGATITAPNVSGTIGGDLTITSLQDVSRFDSKQSSAGISASLCIPPFCEGASYVSGSSSRSAVDGNFTSVTEATGIRAGDGGFQIKVGGNTGLQGGIIASSDNAVSDNKNLLQTATLTTSDLRNRDVYEANGYSVSVSVGSSKSSGSAGVGSAEGAQESVTRAGISGGTIIVTDGTAQAATGKTVDDVLASLDREVTSGNADASALLKAWDATRLQSEVDAQVKITAAFGKAASKAAGNYANQQEATWEGLNNEDEARKWRDGGEYRVALHGAIGLLTGGVQGALGSVASSALLPLVGENIAALNLPKPVADALLIAMGAGIGAVVGSENGAAAGANETANNYISRSLFPEVKRLVNFEVSRLVDECGPNCTKENLDQIDAQVGKLEGLATYAALAKRSTLSPEQSLAMVQLTVELSPIYGSGEALLQLITGRSSVTGEEVSRFWAAVGLIPVAGVGMVKLWKPSTSAISEVIRGVPSTIVAHTRDVGPTIDVADTLKLIGVAAGKEIPASVTNLLRLSTQLAFEEAGILTKGGAGLTKEAVSASRIIPLSDGVLQNRAVVAELTKDGSKIEDWGKFTTQSVSLPSGQRSQIHFYMNKVTGELNLNIDFKVKGEVK
jgi:filamentous hemagglutinin